MLAATIAHYEPVRLGVPKELVLVVKRQVPDAVTCVAMEYDDVWIRDTGPITLVSSSGRPVATDWKFNSWGGLFSSSALDDQIATKVADVEGYESVRVPMVLEGGALTCDGAGTIITTEEVVLAANRNPGLLRVDAESIFERHLNVRNIVWLKYGLAHDEAGGHVDNVCAFASPGTLLLAQTTDQSHPSFSALSMARDTLAAARSADGRPYEIIEVPLPPPTSVAAFEAEGFLAAQGTIDRSQGAFLAPSYINFYVLNGAVVVPTFGVDTDQQALNQIAKAFPDRKIIPFRSREFLLGGGGIHCLTKEIPS